MLRRRGKKLTITRHEIDNGLTSRELWDRQGERMRAGSPEGRFFYFLPLAGGLPGGLGRRLDAVADRA